MEKNKLIKVCGMKYGRNIYEVEQLGVDMIGFIFYSQSPRCISKMPSYLPHTAKRTGVFVNESVTYIQTIAEAFSLNYIQLHGNEPAEYARSLQNEGLKIIKNFSIAGKDDFNITQQYEGVCDYFLFDTKCESYGGSGKQFDWNLLHFYQGNTPFLLSGGIGPESVETLKEFAHSQLAGYDINSRFEIKPGQKEIKKIEDFIKDITL